MVLPCCGERNEASDLLHKRVCAGQLGDAQRLIQSRKDGRDVFYAEGHSAELGDSGVYFCPSGRDTALQSSILAVQNHILWSSRQAALDRSLSSVLPPQGREEGKNWNQPLKLKSIFKIFNWGYLRLGRLLWLLIEKSIYANLFALIYLIEIWMICNVVLISIV